MDGQSVRDSGAKRDSQTRSEIPFTGVSRSTVYRASQAALLTDLWRWRDELFKNLNFDGTIEAAGVSRVV